MINNHQELRIELPPATKWLLLITIVVYFLQLIIFHFWSFDIITLFALSRDSIHHWQLWRGVTYIFLHGGHWHIITNMLVLFMFGREMELILGTRRFLSLYFGCGILAGVGWIIISGNSAGYCLGASGAVFGIIGAFAAMFPARKITLLVFFVLPVTMTARTMAIGLGIISFFSLIWADGNIAHAAHLAGGVAGYLYGRNIRNEKTGRERSKRRGIFGRRINTRFRRKNIRIIPNDSFGVAPSESEVNTLLGKISEKGIGSLSQHERETLDRASEKKK